MRMRGYGSYSKRGGGLSGGDDASSTRGGGVGGEGLLDRDPHPNVNDRQKKREEDRDGDGGDWRDDHLPDGSLDADGGSEFAGVDGDEEDGDDAARQRQQQHHHQNMIMMMMMGNGGGRTGEDDERGNPGCRVLEDDHEGGGLHHYHRQMYGEHFVEQGKGGHREEDLHPTPTGLAQNSGEDNQRRYCEEDHSHHYENVNQDEGDRGKQQEKRKEEQCQEQSMRHIPISQGRADRRDDNGGDGDDGDDGGGGGGGGATVVNDVGHVGGDVDEEDNYEAGGVCDTDATGKDMKSKLPMHDEDGGARGRPLTGSFSESDVDKGKCCV